MSKILFEFYQKHFPKLKASIFKKNFFLLKIKKPSQSKKVERVKFL